METTTEGRIDLARTVLDRFAARTGLVGEAPPRRYLWTDAFAVCTLLELHRASDESRHLELALRLVDQVHRVLGRHREDDPRQGWISGLPQAEGERHPTRGGLRIGKAGGERAPGEALDPPLEWDRDGQYFHYLTRWMHALHQVTRFTGEGLYLRWARELAATAHAAFTVPGDAGPPRRMVWKMSIDLSRPLVPSMGYHDPLDALLTYLELQSAGDGAGGPDLGPQIAEAGELCAGREWATEDPLGIGGLLVDAARLAQVVALRGQQAWQPLLPTLLEQAASSLVAFTRSDPLRQRPAVRLPFRELGLAIGLHGVELLRELLGAASGEVAVALGRLATYVPLARGIEEFWAQEASRRAETWSAHRDINAVMLATSLAPQGYLRL